MHMTITGIAPLGGDTTNGVNEITLKGEDGVTYTVNTEVSTVLSLGLETGRAVDANVVGGTVTGMTLLP